jgi:vanillate O-demethylase ferredoxin subunit
MVNASLNVLLKSITFEAERINSYTLQAIDGGPLPAFTAGAHIEVHLASDLVRSYSLTNDPAERHRYAIAVKHEVDGRGGSAHVHARLKVGDVLQVSAPHNNFVYDEGEHASVFIAGGIGITPILSMMRRATAIDRRWGLHYASRTRRDAAFLAEIEALAAASGSETNIVFDQEAAGAALDIAAIVARAGDGTHLYCCGPLPMLEAFKAATRSRPPHTVHLEYFSPVQKAATAGGFEVRLAKSGRTLAVAPGKTILETLLDAGLPVSYACSEGTCGTCETAVIEGLPDHRDVYLTDEEHAANKQIMICCSGAKTPLLVLDL